jgi:hypothetical protein
MTRIGLVAKKRSFPAQKGDENKSRRQNMEFFASKGDEKGSRRQK